MSDFDTSKVLDLICGSCVLGTTKAEPSMACAVGIQSWCLGEFPLLGQQVGEFPMGMMLWFYVGALKRCTGQKPQLWSFHPRHDANLSQCNLYGDLG